MADKVEIAKTVAQLRESVQRNVTLRATAEQRLMLSRQRLSSIDRNLEEIGINPDNVDEQLKDLESQFTILAEQLATDLKTEADSYNAIIEQTRPAFGESR